MPCLRGIYEKLSSEQNIFLDKGVSKYYHCIEMYEN